MSPSDWWEEKRGWESGNPKQKSRVPELSSQQQEGLGEGKGKGGQQPLQGACKSYTSSQEG